MKIDDLLDVMYLAMILNLFGHGLSTLINPLMWYDFIYSIVFFFLTAIGIKGYIAFAMPRLGALLNER
jgi:hypothetical protein